VNPLYSPFEYVVHPRCFWSTSFRDPGLVPCTICVSTLYALLLIICPKYVNFLAFTDSRRFLDISALFSTQSFVCFAFHDTPDISGKVLAFRMLATFFRLLLKVCNSHNRKLLPARLMLSIASLLSRQQCRGFAKFSSDLHWYTGLC